MFLRICSVKPNELIRRVASPLNLGRNIINEEIDLPITRSDERNRLVEFIAPHHRAPPELLCDEPLNPHSLTSFRESMPLGDRGDALRRKSDGTQEVDKGLRFLPSDLFSLALEPPCLRGLVAMGRVYCSERGMPVQRNPSASLVFSARSVRSLSVVLFRFAVPPPPAHPQTSTSPSSPPSLYTS